ncbi:hypothetical protein ES703_35827 [subsurface metagenome]
MPPVRFSNPSGKWQDPTDDRERHWDILRAFVEGFCQCLTGGEVGGVNNGLVFSEDGVIAISKLYQRLVKDNMVSSERHAVSRAGARKFPDFFFNKLCRFSLRPSLYLRREHCSFLS